MTLNWLAGPICINGTKASSRTLAKRTASIGFLMNMAPSIWLKFDFRGNEHKPVPGLDRADRQVRYRVASASESRKKNDSRSGQVLAERRGGTRSAKLPKKNRSWPSSAFGHLPFL